MALRCSSWVSALECAFQEWEPITVADLSHAFVPQEDTQVCCSRTDVTALPGHGVRRRRQRGNVQK